MPSPSFGTVLDRIGQTQAPLTPTVAMLLGITVLAVVVLPATWLVVRHVETMAHEGAHALVGSSAGGRIQGVRLKPNSNGETRVSSTGSTGNVITGAAGYLGSSAFGLGAAKLISVGHAVAVLWLSLLLLVILLALVRNSFGVFAVVVAGVVIYVVVRYTAVGTETVVAYLITWFLLLSGLRMVLEHGSHAGDAIILARATHVPRVLWAGIWLAGTAAALITGGMLLL
jgi:hypothetical protein